MDPLNLKTMRWAMQSWNRIVFVNRYFAGTVLPRIVLDLIPALKCAAHFMIVADHEPTSLQEFVAAGRAMQRFWLTATSRGLQLQPEMTPLIFSTYVRRDIAFSQDHKALQTARILKDQLDRIVGEENSLAGVFMGRVGYGRPR